MRIPLRCQQARMLVSDYMNGELNQKLASRLEQHLQVCPFCPSLYASLVALRHHMSQLPPSTESAPSVKSRLAQKVRQILIEQ